MYAVIRTGGKQYKVTEGEVIDIEKLDAEIGDEVEFEILFIGDGSSITTDADALAKAKVFGEIVDQFKGKKQLVFKFKKRKNYKKLNGHRQQLTKVRITGISLDGTKPAKKEEPKKEQKEEVVDEAPEEVTEEVVENTEEASEEVAEEAAESTEEAAE